MADETKDFDLASILDGVRQTQVTTEVYLRPDLYQEAFDMNAKIVDAQDQGGAKPTKKQLDALAAARKAVADTTLKVTTRSLSDKEIAVVRDTVIRKNPKTKGASEEIRNLEERLQVDEVKVHLLAVGVVRVEAPDGSSRSGLTLEEARALRETLPSTEWERLVDAFDTAQVQLKALEGVVADPSFRWAAPVK